MANWQIELFLFKRLVYPDENMLLYILETPWANLLPTLIPHAVTDWFPSISIPPMDLWNAKISMKIKNIIDK